MSFSVSRFVRGLIEAKPIHTTFSSWFSRAIPPFYQAMVNLELAPVDDGVRSPLNSALLTTNTLYNRVMGRMKAAYGILLWESTRIPRRVLILRS